MRMIAGERQKLTGSLLGWLALAVASLYAQGVAPEAGKVAVMVPVAKVIRSQPQAQTLPVQTGMTVQWGDKIETERGGRVRVRLTDGSVLNVGSQSSLIIQKHDAQEQNTELDLLYGRIRTNATRIVKPAGQFKVKTRAATAGVVGTEKYVEASDASTTVIALGGGNVSVTSNDARYPDAVLLVPGETVTMEVGRPPQAKRAATAEEMSRAASETESDPVVQITPNQAAPGSRLEATITGGGLESATGYAFENAGIQMTARGAPSATRIPVTITVGPDVLAGNYALTIQRPSGPARGTLVVASRETAATSVAPGAGITLPATMGTAGGTRGVKLTLDASGVQAAPGTQIVRYEWRVLNTQLRSNEPAFLLNTSLLAPGNYNVELTVTDDRNQTVTQRYAITVQAGTQPAEILRALATAYESLQPNEFLRYFDEQKFRNFAGFSAAIEDSFRNQLESMRVFQRAVNCQVAEEQDQAICQADLELRFTKKDQSLQLLDPQGNPVLPGATAPPGSTLGKAVQTGFERTTLRYERGEQGWKIVDYGATVSCPGGGTTSGISVGSCVLAVASAATPSFQLVNLQLSSNTISLGGTVNGSVEVQALGGYTGQVNLSGQAQVSNQPLTVQFNSNPATVGVPVTFTITAPTSAPIGFSGSTSFTLVITGQDTTGNLSASVNAPMILQPSYTLSVSPGSTSGAPLSVTHNSTANLQVSVSGGSGFTGSVLIDFPNLPAGFLASPGSVAAGSTTTFPLQVAASAAPGPALITVRGASTTNVVQTVSVFAVVVSDFTMTATSPTNFVTSPGGTLSVTVNVVPISGFAGTVLVDFLNLPAGLVPTPANATVPAGSSASFSIAVAPSVPIGGISLTIRGTFLSAVRTLAVAGSVQSAPPVGGGPTQTAAPAPTPVAATAVPPSGLPPNTSKTVSTSTTTATAQPDPLASNPLAPTAQTLATGAGATAGKTTTATSSGTTTSVRIERARLRLGVGSCIGFRFSTASELPCGGSADLELSAATASEVTLEAEGVANVGVVPVDKYQAPSGTSSLSRTVTAVSGSTFLVQTRNAQYAVRITFTRQMTGPRGRAGRSKDETTDPDTGTLILVNLEWRSLP